MAGSLTSPWAPPEGRLQDAYRIADMIRDTGRIQAQGQYAKRMAVSNLISDVGGTVVGAFDRHSALKQSQAEGEEIARLLESGNADPAEIIRRVGIDKARVLLPMIESSMARRQAALDKAEAARAKQNEAGMRQRSMGAMAEGADPYKVQQQHYGETGELLPIKEMQPDPKIAAEAKRVEALKAAMAAVQGGADPLKVRQEFAAAGFGELQDSIMPPAPKAVTYDNPEFYVVNGRRTTLMQGSDGKMYDPGTRQEVSIPQGGLQKWVEPKAVAQGPQEPYQWVTRDGKAVHTNKTQPGDTPLNKTSAQTITQKQQDYAYYYPKVKDAVEIMEATESKLTKGELLTLYSKSYLELDKMARQNALSENSLRYFRALQALTNANVRVESGKAATAAEFDRDRLIYGKQYNEGATLAADRIRSRRTILNSIRKGAGAALDEEPEAAPDPTRRGPSVPAGVIGPGGSILPPATPTKAKTGSFTILD